MGKWVHLAESFNTTIETTPFKALYGYDPPQLQLQQQESCCGSFLQDKRHMT